MRRKRKEPCTSNGHQWIVLSLARQGLNSTPPSYSARPTENETPWAVGGQAHRVRRRCDEEPDRQAPGATAPPDRISRRVPSSAASLRAHRRPRIPISQRAGAGHLGGQVSSGQCPPLPRGRCLPLLSDGPFRRRQSVRTSTRSALEFGCALSTDRSCHLLGFLPLLCLLVQI